MSKDNFFLKTKTHRVLTWPARILVFLMLLMFAYLLIPVAKHVVVSYIVDVDQPAATRHLVVENWTADADVFEQARVIASRVGDPEIWALVSSRPYFEDRARKQTMVNAWAAGIDTAKLRLILLISKEPKTFNNARAIVDTASKLGWKELTLVTAVFHSARSKKALLYFARTKGIEIRVLPYFEPGTSLNDWYESDTGQAEAFNEFLKTFFYDIYVFRLHSIV